MQWDEDAFLHENAIIKDMSYFLEPSKAAGLPYYDGFISRYIGYLTFALNYKFHGLGVAGYHIVNIFIHLVNAALVYLFILVTFRTPYFRDQGTGTGDQESKAVNHGLLVPGPSSLIPFFSSLLFVLHPVQTEAVTYIFQRFVPLAALFCLLSLVSYAYSRISDNIKVRTALYLLSILSAILAMKTKENAFTLPLIIALYEFLFFEGGFKKRIVRLSPLLLTLCIIPITVIGTGSPLRQIVYTLATADVGDAKMPRMPYLFTQFRVIITYLRLLVLPVNQNLIYDYQLYKSFFVPQVFGSFIFLAALFGLGVCMVKQAKVKAKAKVKTDSLLAFSQPQPLPQPAFRLIGFGILWFFITLSVESSIIPLPMLIDEYRIYLPSVGFFVAFCTALFMLLERIRTPREKRMMLELAGLVLAVLFGLTYVRNSVWSDRIAFWKDVVANNSHSATAYNNLGNAYLDINQPDKAIEMLDRSIALSPYFVWPYHNRAEAFLRKKEYDKALKDYAKADALQKNYKTYIGMGHLYLEKGKSDLAVRNFLQALALDPHSETALYGLAVCYGRLGKYDEAIQLYSRVLHENPYHSDVYRNRGELYFLHKEYAKALADFNAAVRIDPKDIVSLYYGAIAYHYSGQYDSAIREYGRALALNDKNPVFYDGRGRSFYYKKDYARAIQDFTKAIEFNPKYPRTYSSRGLAWSEIKEFDRAIADFNKAISLDPNLAGAYTDRGNFYLRTGDRARARTDFKRGCALKDADACSSLGKGL